MTLALIDFLCHPLYQLKWHSSQTYLKNYLPRIKKTLVQRGLIVLDPESQTDSESYSVTKYSEAIENNYAIKPIFLNPHIKKTYQNNKTEDSGKWS